MNRRNLKPKRTDFTKENDTKNAGNRAETPKIKQYNRRLQPILDLLPYGPVKLHESKTWLQYLNYSVRPADYPIAEPPYEMQISNVLCKDPQQASTPSGSTA